MVAVSAPLFQGLVLLLVASFSVSFPGGLFFLIKQVTHGNYAQQKSGATPKPPLIVVASVYIKSKIQRPMLSVLRVWKLSGLWVVLPTCVLLGPLILSAMKLRFFVGVKYVCNSRKKGFHLKVP
jgi:hypothetical protein